MKITIEYKGKTSSCLVEDRGKIVDFESLKKKDKSIILRLLSEYFMLFSRFFKD